MYHKHFGHDCRDNIQITNISNRKKYMKYIPISKIIFTIGMLKIILHIIIKQYHIIMIIKKKVSWIMQFCTLGIVQKKNHRWTKDYNNNKGKIIMLSGFWPKCETFINSKRSNMIHRLGI